MYAYHMLGVEASLEGGNDRAGVVAVRAVAIVAEPTHQLSPSLRGAPRIPARLGGRPGEGEPRKGRDDHVERVGRVPAVGTRVGERADQAEVLNHRVGPAVALTPVFDQVLDVVERDAVLPARRDGTRLDPAPALLGRQLVGPAGTRQPLGQVVEVGLGDVDPERPDLGVRAVNVTHAGLLALWSRLIAERNTLFREYNRTDYSVQD